ncbi:MAG: SO2930 family diheme c-type cytochrome [Sandaracinaceae bacterium]
MSTARACLITTLSLALLVSCGDGAMSIDDGPVLVDLTERPPERLSHMRLLSWDPATESIRYNTRVVPYELNTPLFSDFALKARALYIPEGAAAAYNPERPLDLPIGSVIVKTFYYPADLREPERDITLIETRVLRHTTSGWETWPYIWNADQTDATLQVGGETRSITFVDVAGESRTASYLVPQRNQCRSCHERNVGEGGATVLTPIGPAARHLNRDFDYGDGPVNQLSHLRDMGMLDGLPALEEVPAAYDFMAVRDAPEAIADADVDRAARDYLDINCAHCHDADGVQGVTSQLFLNHDNTDEFRLGFCKRPGSAGAGTGGRVYDIVPGSPDESILMFRVETTEVGAMMPLLGRSLEHNQGSALIRRWIQGMEPIDCDAGG